MRRFTHAPERRVSSPPGEAANVSTRATLGRLTTGKSPTESYRYGSSPHGDSALSPPTSPRPKRRSFYTKAAGAALALGLGVTGCSGEHTAAGVANDQPSAPATVQPRQPESASKPRFDLTKPLVLKNICTAAPAEAVWTLFNGPGTDGSGFGCAPDSGGFDEHIVTEAMYDGGESFRAGYLSVQVDDQRKESEPAHAYDKRVTFGGIDAQYTLGTMTIALPGNGDQELYIETDAMNTQMTPEERLQKTEMFAEMLLKGFGANT